MTGTGAATAALEWQRFLELASEEARTAPGKGLIAELNEPRHWAADLATARLRQQEAQETLPLLERDALWGPLTDLADPTALLERLGRGAVLEVEELATLRGWLYAIDSWTQIPREQLRGERFLRMLARLTEPFEPLRSIEKILTPEGELSERASPRLAQLYSEIRSLKREIGVMLDHLLKTFSQKGVLQENFTDVRDGRYVLPVKISHQGDVEGIIYEASASRQTVFVEPKEVSPLNNRLRQRQNDLIQEIHAILRDTSARLQPFAGEIAASASEIAHWDAAQARSRFGRRYSGKPVTVTDDRLFLLRRAAHPLLWWSLKPEEIIRNDIEFGEPARTLLLTGPNTGGKTVLLKTLGLAALCARTGFPFPGDDSAVVPFFDAVFADLGDPQSIEEHLSSFSGHVMRFKAILEGVGGQSLVLIDELNSATDPDEGAALGRAFLESVMEKGAMIVTTTHDPHLKALAAAEGARSGRAERESRILNASMAFDESSRTPTYRMVPGVPGRSRALETAERLGLPASVIDKARGYLSQGHAEFERLLASLERDATDAARARHEAAVAREEAEKLKKEWTERAQASVADMLERARARVKRVVEQAQDEARSWAREQRSHGDMARTQSTATRDLEAAVREEAPEIAEALERKTSVPETPPANSFEVGDTVRIPKWKNLGRLVEIQGDKVKVALGTIQMSMSVGEIEPLSGAEKAAHRGEGRAERSRAKPGGGPPPAPEPKLDLRGQRFEEAMAELERYLDQAFRSGALGEVTIVHGLGTGALREGTRKILGKLPYVKNFRDGGAGQGGAGATVVEFDR